MKRVRWVPGRAISGLLALVLALAAPAAARSAAPPPPSPPPNDPPAPPQPPTQSPVIPAAAPSNAPAPRVTGQPPVDENLHADYDRLLRLYVRPDGVRYAAWQAHKADRLALTDYIHQLERRSLEGWPAANARAFWINLYNAATLRLILINYPLKSIKDLKEPWDKKVVTVGEKPLSLNDIENTILRPTWPDPRVHFALNCAAVSCPPLRRGAYTADSLDFQLSENCRRTLNDPKYLSIAGTTVHMSKIFEWYAADFTPDAMAIREFMSRYVPDNVARKLTDPMYKLVASEYDWKLNAARE